MCQKWRFCVFSRVFWHFLGDNLANNCLVALKTSGNLSHAYLMSFRCSERLGWVYIATGSSQECAFGACLSAKMTYFWLFLGSILPNTCQIGPKLSGSLSHA